MSAAVAAVCGAGIGIGIAVALIGWRGVAVMQLGVHRARQWASRADRLLARSAVAAIAVVVGGSLTGWPVVAVLSGALAWSAPTWLASIERQRRASAIEDAIATWTEQVRDTLAGAHGLEQALVATAPVAPAVIAGSVADLATRCGYEPVTDSLRRFADDVDHPAADFVTAALIIAAEHQARELSGLLGRLAGTTREVAQMRTRLWVARARSRSAVRITVTAVVVMVGGLLLVNREYLRPYDTAHGQVVLGVVVALFALAAWWMARMSVVAMPDRFASSRDWSGASG